MQLKSLYIFKHWHALLQTIGFCNQPFGEKKSRREEEKWEFLKFRRGCQLVMQTHQFTEFQVSTVRVDISRGVVVIIMTIFSRMATTSKKEGLTWIIIRHEMLYHCAAFFYAFSGNILSQIQFTHGTCFW